ncbi:AN1-type zinc finger protein 5-like [Tubulanus polymorphus]|uniref:AN1-type zinc finger protein 5-like n=1 Tax=Tubulanus polymorphus TaxID=672921 RepID=UPI003DA4FF33
MESNGNQNMPPATLCRTGCGFYANAAFDGMCSKCYKDVLKRKQASSSPVSGRSASPASCSQTTSSTTTDASSNTSITGMVATATQTTTPCIDTAMPTVPSTSSVSSSQSETSKDAKDEDDSAIGGATAGAGSDSSDSNDKDKKPKKNRCFTCKKKVGLTGFQCRCGGLYCSLHRYSDKHDCQFNYREHGQELIKKQNPVVVGEKIQKI